MLPLNPVAIMSRLEEAARPQPREDGPSFTTTVLRTVMQERRRAASEVTTYTPSQWAPPPPVIFLPPLRLLGTVAVWARATPLPHPSPWAATQTGWRLVNTRQPAVGVEQKRRLHSFQVVFPSFPSRRSMLPTGQRPAARLTARPS